MNGPPDLCPVCPRCRRRHLPELSCWTGGKQIAHARALVLATYGDTCHICGQPGARTVDHLIPRSRGGTDDIRNLRPAHLFCNVVAGNRTPIVRTEVSDRW